MESIDINVKSSALSLNSSIVTPVYVVSVFYVSQTSHNASHGVSNLYRKEQGGENHRTFYIINHF